MGRGQPARGQPLSGHSFEVLVRVRRGTNWSAPAATLRGYRGLPGLRLHGVIGDRAGIWSVTVSGNWRVTFRFEDGDAEIVNYEDYH